MHCKVCNKEKEKFYKDESKASGFHSRCADCSDSKMSEWRKAHPEHWREVANRAKTRYRNKYRDALAKIKLDSGCVDCGYRSHHAALDFDHLANKSFDIAVSIGSKSWESIIKEVGKCEVVCANCHRVRTYNRRREKAIA